MKYHATKNEAPATGCWCSLPCSILLKYLHPKQKIEQVMPIKSCEHKQQLQDCVVVSQETRNMKRRPNGEGGEANGDFDQKVLDLPFFTNNAPNFSPDLLDMGRSGSRSEDIALACSQGLDVDDDNKPAPDTTSNLHGQT
ncbi:hypothetical protein FRACYDRAFT_249633 [Fragilariopsis cylindrus CCMP1102]|uniref:Uncharacterized protein n=1 Tax=Fragilariopsis cylindrus CCMP1102 TaxID=635003 RepID=A0A1E7ERU0_9STRA|nr:hypothetical protein FRACYDRAFT_249633 [Fragilariopsis cylindrus CCMP1102]|eukprot:OEU08730.1 hypothetical protein FRACYDRAFT_249633 [Fragilariopsis cylindrus CCMP1102]